MKKTKLKYTVIEETTPVFKATFTGYPASSKKAKFLTLNAPEGSVTLNGREIKALAKTLSAASKLKLV
jgi:hypothetical protein